MKLVIDLRLIHNSGIGTYIKNVIPLIISGFGEVLVLGDPVIIKKFEWSKKLEIIPFRYKVYSFKEQLMLPVYIPKCDVFWTPHFNAPLLPIKATKRMVTIHDVNHLSNPAYFSYIKRLWAKVLYKNAVKRSDTICTVSKFSKSEILKFFTVDPHKINVVYCGVDQNFVKNVMVDSGLELPTNYFLFVGNVKPHKNLITLLKAYNQLTTEIKEKYKLVVLGRKEGFITQETAIFRYIEDNNLSKNIYFTGYVSDNLVSDVYKNATLFIFPSLYEGFGLPLLEAMSCGVPVLSSDMASLIEVGGEAVVYFNPKEANDLKENIVQLLDNQELRIKCVEKGFEQIKKFSWQRSADKHIIVLNNLYE
ncbi:glycosyltransferase family 1 protein [Aquimarina sp. MMG016]|uniref:glycosyltransferase family 4 protein n=1 Tax=Aquimarina sp. MMG016 TaxID=2822690 RepID=UPI001B3A591C|nr:glycosyltransferase family 1 protein [Aquimarina sp. MMG016]MBQ4820095.1 glycosyltransferase family 4 protein [Aquimarina sp. MMG016]